MWGSNHILELGKVMEKLFQAIQESGQRVVTVVVDLLIIAGELHDLNILVEEQYTVQMMAVMRAIWYC